MTTSKLIRYKLQAEDGSVMDSSHSQYATFSKDGYLFATKESLLKSVKKKVSSIEKAQYLHSDAKNSYYEKLLKSKIVRVEITTENFEESSMLFHLDKLKVGK